MGLRAGNNQQQISQIIMGLVGGLGGDHFVMFKLQIMIVADRERNTNQPGPGADTNNKLSVINSGLFSVSIFSFCLSFVSLWNCCFQQTDNED